MGFISEAIRLIGDRQEEKRSRQRGEDHLRQLEIEELERRARRRTPQESGPISPAVRTSEET